MAVATGAALDTQWRQLEREQSRGTCGKKGTGPVSAAAVAGGGSHVENLNPYSDTILE